MTFGHHWWCGRMATDQPICHYSLTSTEPSRHAQSCSARPHRQKHGEDAATALAGTSLRPVEDTRPQLAANRSSRPTSLDRRTCAARCRAARVAPGHRGVRAPAGRSRPSLTPLTRVSANAMARNALAPASAVPIRSTSTVRACALAGTAARLAAVRIPRPSVLPCRWKVLTRPLRLSRRCRSTGPAPRSRSRQRCCG
jgi:hypothetical protein